MIHKKHEFILFRFVGLRTALVQELQGAHFGPWLRQQSADHLEVPVDGQTGRVDRTHVSRAPNRHVAGWQHRDECGGRRNTKTVELLCARSQSDEEGQEQRSQHATECVKAKHSLIIWNVFTTQSIVLFL